MSNARFSIMQSRAVEDAEISNSQFRTLAALGMFGDKDGWCFPKLSTLAALLHKSKQAVSKDLQMLCELGYVDIKKQFRPDGSQQHNLYRLLFDTHQPDIDPPSTSEVEGGSTSEVDALTPHVNAPKEEEAGDDFEKMVTLTSSITGLLPSGAAGHKAIAELIGMGALEEDISAGYQWVIENQGKFQYYSKLVGPVKTAMSIRHQKSMPLAAKSGACVPVGGNYGGSQ
jgi:hypothetical protein